MSHEHDQDAPPGGEGAKAEEAWAENVEPNPSAGPLLAFALIAITVVGAVALVRDWPGAERGPAPDPAARTEGPVCPREPLAPSLSMVAAQRERDRALVQAGDAPAGAEALLEAWRAYNREEAAGLPAAELATRNAALAARMADFAQREGFDAYRRVGWAAIDALEALLVALGERARGEALDLPAFAARHPADPQVIALADHAGDLLAHAQDSALLEARPDDPVAEGRRRFWVRLLAKARWLLWVRDLRPVEAGLSRFEAAQLTIWRAERRRDQRPEAALGTVAELRRLHPDGRWAWQYGCRYLAWGRADLARRLFLAELALHPDHGPSRAALELVDGLPAPRAVEEPAHPGDAATPRQPSPDPR